VTALKKQRSTIEIRQLAEGAKAILADPAFLAAREEAEARLMAALVVSKTTEEKLELVAKLKCLTQIAAELAVLMNDYRMAADRARGARPS
jgi:hypothetical protein